MAEMLVSYPATTCPPYVAFPVEHLPGASQHAVEKQPEVNAKSDASFFKADLGPDATIFNAPATIDTALAAARQEGIPDDLSVVEKAAGFVRKHKVGLAIGALATASVVSDVLTIPAGDTLRTVKETLPYVGGGMVAAEIAWIGGAALALASCGKRIFDVRKIKSGFSGLIKELPTTAKDNKWFMIGLGINTAGALAEFAIPAAAVATKLPPEAWGVLAPSTFDLFLTVGLRAAIWRSLHRA